MKQIEINYTKNAGLENEFHGTVILNVPEDIHELINIWGENVAYNKAMAQIVIDARRVCYSAETPEEAQEYMNTWSPVAGIQRKTSGMSKKAILAIFEGKSKEEISDMLKKLGIN